LEPSDSGVSIGLDGKKITDIFTLNPAGQWGRWYSAKSQSIVLIDWEAEMDGSFSPDDPSCKNP